MVPAMLNLGLSGQPFATHDIAGFSGGPSTKELYMRWTELAPSAPSCAPTTATTARTTTAGMRMTRTQRHFSRFARVHEALADERIAMAAEAEQTGIPMVRHLLLEWPSDREAWLVHDQFMLGSELLVAPVVTEGATTRRVYLPEGLWFHVWTGDTYDGPVWVDVAAELGAPPVFSREKDRADLRAIQ